MSYFDWTHLVKPFSFQPVVQDTVENTKALSVTPVVAVGTLLEQILIPETTLVPIWRGNGIIPGVVPLIVYQFDYTLDKPFTILNWKNPAFRFNLYQCEICIRYRVGNTVTRYRLFSWFNTAWSHVYAPLYTGQVIQPNFVIEVWQFGAVPAGADSRFVIAQDIILQTGAIHIPIDENDTSPLHVPTRLVTLAQLQYPIPETLPTTPDSGGAWLTN